MLFSVGQASPRAGYWHNQQMDSLAAQGDPAVDPTGRGQAQDRPPGVGRRAVHLDALPARDEKRSGFHRKRQVTVELVFAQRVFNHTLTRFHRRARAAMHSESRLMAAGHNLLKVHNHRVAPAGT